MSHWQWIKLRLGRSHRIRFGLMVLAFIVLPAIFAELLAADAPIFATGPDGVAVLPAVVVPDGHEDMSRTEIIEHYEGHFAVWPYIRCGPLSRCDIGPEAPSSFGHPLGTDELGRDILARLVYGARAALGLAMAALLLALFFGALMGTLAGYLGGFWDEMLSRPVELVEAFPAIIVVAVVRAVVDDATMWSLVFAVAAIRWAEIARLVRAEVVRISSAEYVLAARALGCTNLRILRRHILPHAARPVIVSSMFGVGSVVMLEVAVSFLGLGTQGSWGAMIADGLQSEAAARSAIWSGAAIAVTVLSAYLIADAIEEAIDARVATTSRGL